MQYVSRLLRARAPGIQPRQLVGVGDSQLKPACAVWCEGRTVGAVEFAHPIRQFYERRHAGTYHRKDHPDTKRSRRGRGDLLAERFPDGPPGLRPCLTWVGREVMLLVKIGQPGA